ncbi:MAG: hypothetical protein OER90_16220 [Gemmatimonadota bacterium]|nr:hypothetical protein [Gemmatimonadota bacterium]
MRTAVLVGAFGPLAACAASWRPVASEHWSERPAPRERYQVWRQGDAMQLHGLIFGADSLWGVPVDQHPTCLLCRIAIPLAVVDSVSVRSDPTPVVLTVAISAALVGAALYVIGSWSGGT